LLAQQEGRFRPNCGLCNEILYFAQNFAAARIEKAMNVTIDQSCNEKQS